MKKKISLSLLLVFILFAYSFVLGQFASGDSYHISLDKIVSKNIYLDSYNLNKTIISYKSDIDISDFKFHSLCKIKTDFIANKEDVYFFQLTFLDDKCSNPNLFLSYDSKILPNTGVKLEFFNRALFFSELVDYPDYKISQMSTELSSYIDKLSIYKDYDEKFDGDYFDFLMKNRLYKELSYKKDYIDIIIKEREKKYLIPVLGYDLPTRKDKIPNASRSYRKEYTDGIHHSWDIDTPFGEKVVSIDYGVVVRVVDDWNWNDFSNLRNSGDISYEDSLRNLDIYRGNQVWIKTTKGDVVFYAHLNNIFSDIKVGTIVQKGYPLGTIGISGVPDKNYSDYHLDFSIQKNPYDIKMAGKYYIYDYMSWDWYFKGESRDYILQNQYDVFTKEL